MFSNFLQQFEVYVFEKHNVSVETKNNTTKIGVITNQKIKKWRKQKL